MLTFIGARRKYSKLKWSKTTWSDQHIGLRPCGLRVGIPLTFPVLFVRLIWHIMYLFTGLETDFSQVSDWMSKLDETLSRYNVDSASCMQRLTCSYVQLANENVLAGNATDFDTMLSSLSRYLIKLRDAPIARSGIRIAWDRGGIGTHVLFFSSIQLQTRNAMPSVYIQKAHLC